MQTTNAIRIFITFGPLFSPTQTQRCGVPKWGCPRPPATVKCQRIFPKYWWSLRRENPTSSHQLSKATTNRCWGYCLPENLELIRLLYNYILKLVQPYFKQSKPIECRPYFSVEISTPDHPSGAPYIRYLRERLKYSIATRSSGLICKIFWNTFWAATNFCW